MRIDNTRGSNFKLFITSFVRDPNLAQYSVRSNILTIMQNPVRIQISTINCDKWLHKTVEELNRRISSKTKNTK